LLLSLAIPDGLHDVGDNLRAKVTLGYPPCGGRPATRDRGWALSGCDTFELAAHVALGSPYPLLHSLEHLLHASCAQSAAAAPEGR
jgi:hypothetical protein